MSNWVIRCSEKYLQGVYDILKEELLRRDIIQADETTVQVLSEPSKAATTDSFMWLYRSGEWNPESQIILYEYQDNRRKENPANFLGNFKGYLQTDGYAGYNSVTKREKDPAISVGCWAHARRYFCDALKAIKKGNSNAPATNIRKAIAYADRIFAIERDSDMAKKPPQERMRIRKEKTLPILDEYFNMTWSS